MYNKLIKDCENELQIPDSRKELLKELLEAFKEQRDLLSSAQAIAMRNGENTHWRRFSSRLAEFGITHITPKPFKILQMDMDEGDDGKFRSNSKS